MQLSQSRIDEFRGDVWTFYKENRRAMPWREDPSPYKVLVSELMLQQTQVARVIPKFDAFMYTCIDFASLAEKSLAEVLALWSGLGYNRRARFLHQTAQIIMHDYDGHLPDTYEELIKLPGIGKNTAGAILAYAYEKPTVFVETNIRTVYFHHFYPEADASVSDADIAALVEHTMDREHVREWYYALMDYGTYLKKSAGARLSTSKHYKKQAPLRGSMREMRGRILKVLVSGGMPREALGRAVESDERFGPALQSLQNEGFIEDSSGTICLTGARETS